ncbi:MAG: hypothetical protein RIC53_07600 [Cyclobacteriaceae bacterium]
MHLNINQLRNKQRIYIGGNHGVNKIYKIVKHVLEQVGKPADYFTVGADNQISDAPIVFIKGGDEVVNGEALFHQLDVHILLIHCIDDDIPEGYESFENYIAQYETLADYLPKSGSFLFYEGDNVATLMGKKEREDVRNFEYTELDCEKTANGYVFKVAGESFEVISSSKRFPQHAAGAKALLQRIGVSEAQFYSALKTLS